MLEKPDFPETLIANFVKQAYGLAANQVIFLPLGYDVNTAVYRVEAQDGQNYFLKLRRGVFNPITVDLPNYLNNLGIGGIIAPLEARDGRLHGNMEPFTTILYPFILGRNGYEVRLTEVQWVQLGNLIWNIHQVQLPDELRQQIPRERYEPKWRRYASHFLSQVDHRPFKDPIARRLATFMQEHRQVISIMIQRADLLARSLQKQPLECVLCHSDAHPGNYHVTEQGDLYLVDWDNPIYAPRERDLMCFGGGMSGDQPGGREENLFYQGYEGRVINHPALAYYRYERIIQDVAEFCKQIFSKNSGDEDRLQSYQYFISSFNPGGVVEAAIHTDDCFSSAL